MDGTQMPTSSATITQAEMQSWTSDVEAKFADLDAAFAVLKTARPNDPNVTAVGDAIYDACAKCTAMKTAAWAKLSPPVNAPLYSGGRPKTPHS